MLSVFLTRVVMVAFLAIGVSASSRDMKEILASGELKIATHATEQPPFLTLGPDKTPGGWEVEMAKDIAANLGVKPVFDFSPRSYDEAVERVASGRSDIAISFLSATLKRATSVLFSKPYYSFPLGLLVRRDWLTAKGLRSDDADGVLRAILEERGTIAAEWGTSFAQIGLPFIGRGNRTAVEDEDACFATVATHKARAWLDDRFTLDLFLARNPETSLRFAIVPVREEKDRISIAVSPNAERLCRWLDLYVESHRHLFESRTASYLNDTISATVESDTETTGDSMVANSAVAIRERDKFASFPIIVCLCMGIFLFALILVRVCPKRTRPESVGPVPSEEKEGAL